MAVKRPFILSPAGSSEALYAALYAGADEIYFGLGSYNARQNAKNFTIQEAKEAIRACRLHGVKTNITLNTLVSDREIKECCMLAYDAMCMGADAFIVQDLGLAHTLKKAIPEITLHASTQCACHSRAGAEFLAELGFERIVLARELDKQEIKSIVDLGIETEIFVHGALCVCHSGMCLMSSVIGKRSGNRGLCAQPCRLPYNFGKQRENEKNVYRYPLSLKDLSDAKHVMEILELGVTSLKIEGRMKSPEYVYGVTDIWKTIISQERNATEQEYENLGKLFSRSGFADGYFTGKYRSDNKEMYGIRTQKDKSESRQATADVYGKKSKRGIQISCNICPGKPAELTILCDNIKVCCTSDFIAQPATSRPMTKEDINASLTKLGETEFLCTCIQTELCGNVFIPKSLLNGLRRKGIELLKEKILSEIKAPSFDLSCIEEANGCAYPKQAKLRFCASNVQMLEEMLSVHGGYEAESVCIPLGLFKDEKCVELIQVINEKGIIFGTELPRVVFTQEMQPALKLLEKAKEYGAKYAVAQNVGHIGLIKKSGLDLYTAEGMNVFNSFAVRTLEKAGALSITLSPELLTAQMRDMYKGQATRAVVAAGRLELMVLESCVIRANSPCKKTQDLSICAELCDRTGAVFPIKAQQRLTDTPFPCRNIVLNSVPVHLIDKKDELKKTKADIYVIRE